MTSQYCTRDCYGTTTGRVEPRERKTSCRKYENGTADRLAVPFHAAIYWCSMITRLPGSVAVMSTPSCTVLLAMY
jgi:hypothetical protein